MSTVAQERRGVPSKIVVGTDGSVTAERAVWKAAAWAKAVDAELIVVSAYNSRGPAGVASVGVAMDAQWAASAQSVAETCVKEAIEEIGSLGVDSVSSRAVAGEPAEVLIRVTEDEKADLLVVGSKGMQSTARFLLGPIANKVSRRVACDLLIVETSE
jgi:nucleotide-binding universal stress UspA family protein